MQNQTTLEVTHNVTPLGEISYKNVLAGLEESPQDVALLAQKEAIEAEFTDLVQSAKSDKMEAQFMHLKNLIDGAKSLDLILEDIVYFLTDCESSTIRDYKSYLISLNRSFEEVKTLNLMSKKQIFKQLVQDVQSEIRKHLEGFTFFNKGGITGQLKPIEIILNNYEWVVDLSFNDTIDQPKHRLELLKQIERISIQDNHTKELKIYNLEHFKNTGEKVRILSNNDIKTLNTQKSQRGGGVYATYSAQSLAQHIKDLLDTEVTAIKKELEEEQKAQTIKNAIEAKARMRKEIELEMAQKAPLTIEAPQTTQEG